MKVEVNYKVFGRIFEVPDKFKALENEDIYETEKYYDLSNELSYYICDKIEGTEGDISIDSIYTEDGEPLYEE